MLYLIIWVKKKQCDDFTILQEICEKKLAVFTSGGDCDIMSKNARLRGHFCECFAYQRRTDREIRDSRS